MSDLEPIREIIQDTAPRILEPPVDGTPAGEPCPTCGAQAYYLKGRIVDDHDPGQHRLPSGETMLRLQPPRRTADFEDR